MKYTHDYLARQFWNGEKGCEKLEMNETGYEEALRRALKDFTPRTEKKKADSTEKLDVDKMLAKLKEENFLDRFVDFFDGKKCENAEKFDEWHDGMCEKFLNVFRDYYDSLAYGKAQKIVNMTFKGIYCLNGAEKKEEYFRYCHMPLDSLTLEWFRRNVKIDGKQVVKKNVAPWSKLSNDIKAADGKYTYEQIQKAIRYFFNEETGWTPLTAEFLIWPQIQLELAAEGLYSNLYKLDGTELIEPKDFRKKTTVDKIKFLKDNIGKINFDFICGNLSEHR